MVDGTIRSMVNALGDPYSVYLDAETFKQLMDEQIHGSFGGLGLVVRVKEAYLS
ncbi:hypothetical protein [Desulfoscipio gibsoniae]|uniref:hypothetical protein n=1 Tax=Desulfoscipio gibsoniae TaxID=102134 RepID=UPI000232B763|nr:hypothetical protein [Desulfoscipio gibsoniae]